jgi:outer membrane protein
MIKEGKISMAPFTENTRSIPKHFRSAWFKFFVLWISLLTATAPSYATSSLRPSRQCPVPEKPPAHYTQAGDWFTRLRALYFAPRETSKSFSSGPYNLGGVDIRPCGMGEFDFGCMITQHFGFEIGLSTGKTSIQGTRAIDGTKIGNTWLFPPTLTFQWRFATNQTVQPYIGAGGNYTLFYGAKSSLPYTSLHLCNSWGPVAQGGIDLFFCDNYRWLFNIDVKYIWSETKARLKTYDVTTFKTSARIDLNPWIFACGIGCKW